MARSVTVIHAKKVIDNTKVENKENKKIRVAAYCRVSTDQDEQLNSFENQVQYYTNYINNNPKYKMAGIYADEGISGTNAKKRKEFMRMIEDCEAKKIDLVITKSISRFARNTQDCLMYSRKLKNLGIGIIFEKENISTLDSTGELLFTILSSLAQDESRNISENCKWGIRSKFQKGIPHINTYKFMGYDKNEEGRLVINNEEAKLVRRIYREFLEGFNPANIAKRLNEEGIPGVSGKPKWLRVTIEGMLKNEKYKGDSLLQKTYTADFLTRKQVKNNGEVDQYYVENSHPAIIKEEEWEAVQQEFKRRKEYMKEHKINRYGYNGCDSPYISKVVCGCCGEIYGRKSWASRNTHYWECNRRFKKKGSRRCVSFNIKEEILNKTFVIAWNSIINIKDELMKKWKKQIQKGEALQKLRAKQMIELTNEGKIDNVIPELLQMVLEKIVVENENLLMVYFLDGTSIEVNLK